MTKIVKVPTVPKINKDEGITKENRKHLLEWKAAFEGIGCIVDLEEDSGGFIKLNEGTVMHVVFSIFPEDIKVLDFGFGEAILYIDNKASVHFVQTLTRFNDTFDTIEYIYSSPITREYTEGSWSDIYNLIVIYMDFRKELIPLAPK